MPVAMWMRRLAIAGVLLCFLVVVLGAYVRLTAAGLGCPDWPGCYGHLSPVGAAHSADLSTAFPDRPLEERIQQCANLVESFGEGRELAVEPASHAGAL